MRLLWSEPRHVRLVLNVASKREGGSWKTLMVLPKHPRVLSFLRCDVVSALSCECNFFDEMACLFWDNINRFKSHRRCSLFWLTGVESEWFGKVHIDGDSNLLVQWRWLSLETGSKQLAVKAERTQVIYVLFFLEVMVGPYLWAPFFKYIDC